MLCYFHFVILYVYVLEYGPAGNIIEMVIYGSFSMLKIVLKIVVLALFLFLNSTIMDMLEYHTHKNK